MLEGLILSALCVHEYTAEMHFDSGVSLTAYGRVIFLETDTECLGVVDDETANITIRRDFLGARVSNVLYAEGRVEILFYGGRRIILERIGQEPELGLLSYPDGLKVLS